MWTGEGMAYTLVLFSIFATIAVTVGRLHVPGSSGWWWFLSLLCGIGAIILFVFCLMEGTRGPNEYGPDPKS